MFFFRLSLLQQQNMADDGEKQTEASAKEAQHEEEKEQVGIEFKGEDNQVSGH